MSAYKDNFALIDWSWAVRLPEGRERRIVERSDLACPMVVTDSMSPVQSMTNGQLYDSKSAIRAEYKRAGVVEVGNDPARLQTRRRPKVDRQAVKDTLDHATARFERGERA
jgi:hypothetical protein